jgi:hypothetical protein
MTAVMTGLDPATGHQQQQREQQQEEQEVPRVSCTLGRWQGTGAPLPGLLQNYPEGSAVTQQLLHAICSCVPAWRLTGYSPALASVGKLSSACTCSIIAQVRLMSAA